MPENAQVHCDLDLDFYAVHKNPYTQTQTHGCTTELQGDHKSFGPKQQSCDNYTCTEICAEGKEIQVWIPNGHHKPGGQCHACFRLISRV